MPSVILVTSGQPSLNPRLVKEANALTDAGYDVTVFYAYWNEWGTRYDEELLAQSKWKAFRIGGSPQQGRLTYLLSKILFKIGRAFNHSIFAVWGSSRATYYLLKEVKKHKADLYIAHNLGALPAVYATAKKYVKPWGFDAEDFHRNEVTDDTNHSDVIRKSAIENRYIPQANYVTASSPEIANLYRTVFPQLKPTVLLNVFDKTDILQLKINKPLKLFWFSQTIGPGRGIEDVIEALNNFKEADFELHLLGHQSTDSIFIEKLKSAKCVIKFHAPISPDSIISFASQFDIGLAIEPGFSRNNDAALSNKLFTYMQAGLAVVATQTTAQAAFMQQNPNIGSTYKSGDIKTFAAIITDFMQNEEKLLACKQASLHLARQKYNWETEKEKFLRLIAQTI